MNTNKFKLVDILRKIITFIVIIYSISFILLIIPIFYSYIISNNSNSYNGSITLVHILLYTKWILLIIMSFNLIIFLKNRRINNEDKMLKILLNISYIATLSGIADILYKFRNIQYSNIKDGMKLETSYVYFIFALVCIIKYNKLKESN